MARDAVGPLVALVVVQLSFASLPVAGKFVLEAGLPPLALAGVRAFCASLLLGAVALARSRAPLAFADLARLAALSLLGVVINQILFLEGLARTTAINAGVLIVTIPVFTLVTAVAVRREHFDRVRLAGVLVATAGTLLLLHVERFNPSDRAIVGNLLIVLNSLSYSVYLVYARELLQRHPSTTVVAWTFLFGSLVMLPLGVPDLTEASAAGALTPMVGLALLWIVLVPSALAYGLNNYALKRVHASTVGGFVLLQPLFTAALALALLPGERLELRTILAAALLLLGVLVVARTEPRAVVTGIDKPINAEPVPPDRG